MPADFYNAIDFYNELYARCTQCGIQASRIVTDESDRSVIIGVLQSLQDDILILPAVCSHQIGDELSIGWFNTFFKVVNCERCGKRGRSNVDICTLFQWSGDDIAWQGDFCYEPGDEQACYLLEQAERGL